MQARLGQGLRLGLSLGLSWGLATGMVAAGGWMGAQAMPAFGPGVVVLDPAMPQAQMQATIDRIYGEMRGAEFGEGRHAILLKPGEYHLNLPIGFYTQVLGLGATPDAVRVVGDVHVDAAYKDNNATTTFWRAAEGFSVEPAGGSMQWAVSQGVDLRRMHVRGDLLLHQHHGWASGGWLSDSVVDGTVDSGSQQQWISRNDEWRRWTGSNWNQMFVGVTGAPAQSWPEPPFTTVARTPVSREKPFLEVDGHGVWGVKVPAVRRESVGVSWRGGETPGRVVPLDHFFLARPGRDGAEAINAALAKGKDLLLLPGTFSLTEPIRVTRPGTAVLGLGFATLRPTAGTAAMTVADVDGVTVSGVLFEAGAVESPVLLEVGGAAKTGVRHTGDPASLHDVWFREGGAIEGKVGMNLLIRSNDALVDDTWIWRADHGDGVGWTKNTSRNGLVVEGDDVTAYGLFVEHHQENQVVWRGERGRTYFYQSEIPYDPPDQAAWSSAPGVKGWASYKVADGVTTHEAWGMGIYSVFTQPDVVLTRAISVPKRSGVRMHDMITVALGERGGIENVIDDAGGATEIKPRVTPKVTNFP